MSQPAQPVGRAAAAHIHVQRHVLNLMLKAAKRACGGRMPSGHERQACSAVEETTNGVLCRWKGEPILLIQSTPYGIAHEFLGAAKGP